MLGRVQRPDKRHEQATDDQPDLIRADFHLSP
jgi:hypothetical protein